jgi:hypothetical protein
LGVITAKTPATTDATRETKAALNNHQAASAMAFLLSIVYFFAFALIFRHK